MNSGNFAEAKIMTRMLFFTHTGPIFRLMSDRLTGVKKRIQGIAIFPFLCNLLLFVFDTRKMRFKSGFFVLSVIITLKRSNALFMLADAPVRFAK